MYTPGILGGDNGTLRLSLRSRPQPDAFLLVLPSHGGNAQIDEQDYIVGAPEWVGEVAASSENYDLHDKLEIYREAGIKEYVVWRVLEREIDWFVLRGKRYERLALSPDGIFRSETFPGLWMDTAAMIARDKTRLMAVAQQGLASPEHAQFVEQLNQRAATAS